MAEASEIVRTGRKRVKGQRRLDLVGLVFGRLAVIRREHSADRRSSYWFCACECGTRKVVRGSDLTRGHVQSCGCTWRYKFVYVGTENHKPILKLAADAILQAEARLEDSLQGELALFRARRALRKKLPLHSAEQLEYALERAWKAGLTLEVSRS